MAETSDRYSEQRAQSSEVSENKLQLAMGA
jgi:hypothetical protein